MSMNQPPNQPPEEDGHPGPSPVPAPHGASAAPPPPPPPPYGRAPGDYGGQDPADSPRWQETPPWNQQGQSGYEGHAPVPPGAFPQGSSTQGSMPPGPQHGYYQPAPPHGQYPPGYYYSMNPPKSRLAAGLLGIFLGGFGVHRFYLGYTSIGVVQILVTVFTWGLGAIWGFVEGIMILAGAQSFRTDSRGVPLRE